MKRKSRRLQKDKSHNITNEGEFYDKNSPSLAFYAGIRKLMTS